jgi:hypothetical protein
MLCALWSPNGGAGTSAFAAACALVAARHRPTRLADFDGDQPAILAFAPDPATGLADWLAIGPEAPADALERFALAIAPNLTLLPRGARSVFDATPEAGAALGVVLSQDERITFADVGRAEAPALRALVEVADASIVVVRECYLALRHCVRSPEIVTASGAIAMDEADRGLTVRDIADIIPVPVVATAPFDVSIGRRIDAGVYATRLPSGVTRAATLLCQRIGVFGAQGAAA